QIGTSIADLDGYAASDLLKVLDKVVAVADGVRLRAVSRIEQSGVWNDAVNGTPNSFLRSRHRRDHGEAGRDLRAAKLASEFKVVSEAMAAGRISRAHVDVIVSIGQRNESRTEALPAFLPIFVELAAQVSVADLRRTMMMWADQVDDDAGDDPEQNAHNRRYLHVSMVGDGVKLDGFFAPEAGAKIQAVMNALMAELYRDGDPTSPVTGLKLSTPVQRADAFEVAMNRLLGSGTLARSGGAPASVAVTVPLSRLEDPCCTKVSRADLLANLKVKLGEGLAGQLDERAKSGQPLDLARLLVQGSASLGVSNGPGELVLSAQAAQRMTCDCVVQQVLLSPKGEPLAVGRAERFFTPSQRKALNVRDGGCVFPWCQKPPSWCDAHHIKHWIDGGETNLDNAALLCSHHHHQVHADKHRVYIGSDGRATVELNKRRR
ncbi:MAG: DUF222 domain-containing protein, partial [Candidatus Nanopelagicales bacterium]